MLIKSLLALDWRTPPERRAQNFLLRLVQWDIARSKAWRADFVGVGMLGADFGEMLFLAMREGVAVRVPLQPAAGPVHLEGYRLWQLDRQTN